MSYYESEAVKDTEEMALKLLKEIDIECSASNMHVKTDVDITTAAGKKIDDNKYKERVTEKILIIKIAELHNYINNNAAALFEQIKINDKNRYNLSDKHGSAFLPIDVCCLKKDCKCFFDTWEKLCKQKENIKNYIY